MRHNLFVRALHAVFHAFAAHLLDIHQVKVGAVGNAHQLLAANCKVVFNVDRLLAVMRPILGRYIKLVDVLLSKAQLSQELVRAGQQLVKGRLPLTWVHKIFNLHLLELAGPEHKVARRDFITKGLALLSNTKRQVRVKGIHHIFVIGKNPLGGFGAQVADAIFAFGGATWVLNIILKVRDLLSGLPSGLLISCFLMASSICCMVMPSGSTPLSFRMWSVR